MYEEKRNNTMLKAIKLLHERPNSYQVKDKLLLTSKVTTQMTVTFNQRKYLFCAMIVTIEYSHCLMLIHMFLRTTNLLRNVSL